MWCRLCQYYADIAPRERGWWETSVLIWLRKFSLERLRGWTENVGVFFRFISRLTQFAQHLRRCDHKIRINFLPQFHQNTNDCLITNYFFFNCLAISFQFPKTDDWTVNIYLLFTWSHSVVTQISRGWLCPTKTSFEWRMKYSPVIIDAVIRTHINYLTSCSSSCLSNAIDNSSRSINLPYI